MIDNSATFLVITSAIKMFEFPVITFTEIRRSVYIIAEVINPT